MLKYLRIAVSATCLIVCALLVALWVRSYWKSDCVSMDRNGKQVISVLSNAGVLTVSETEESALAFPWGWSSSPPGKNEFRFEYRAFPGLWYIRIPHWLPALVAIVLATILWLPYRFNLRTLLIATTLVAVVFGIIVVSS